MSWLVITGKKRRRRASDSSIGRNGLRTLEQSSTKNCRHRGTAFGNEHAEGFDRPFARSGDVAM